MHEQVWKLIDECHYITLISHINPDADTLGSALAFYPALKRMGKNVSLVNTTELIANKYDFLPNFNKIKKTLPVKCELLISFDCGSFDRLGIEKGSFKIINIDHHQSNTLFGDLNIIKTEYASCTLVAHDLLEHHHKITKEEALCIYTGLVDDTGFFTHPNTDAFAFESASKLISKGINPSEVSQNLKMRNSLAKTRLTALFINSIELINDAEIAVGTISQQDLKHTGALKNDTDHLVDILKNLSTVNLAIMLLEEKDSSYKVSLRSKNNLDVSTIAQAFNGGGHQRAAGFESSHTDRVTIMKQIMEKTTL